MSAMTEEHTKPSLSLGRKPIGKGNKDSAMGTQALNDSLMILVGCWVILALIWFSLRNSNI
jgi:hypothetical protein